MTFQPPVREIFAGEPRELLLYQGGQGRFTGHVSITEPAETGIRRASTCLSCQGWREWRRSSDKPTLISCHDFCQPVALRGGGNVTATALSICSLRRRRAATPVISHGIWLPRRPSPTFNLWTLHFGFPTSTLLSRSVPHSVRATLCQAPQFACLDCVSRRATTVTALPLFVVSSTR
jgi:hypothetical protein